MSRKGGGESLSANEKLPLEALLAHQGFLAGLARRLVDNEADAEDLVQNAWVAALQGPAPRGPNLRAWLAAVARNRWRNRQQSETALANRERLAARPESLDTEQAERGLEERTRVIEAVRALPEPYLTTIYLRYYEERPIADVAKRTGVHPKTARARIQRGIELLRAKLDREFGSRGSWMVAVGTWCRPGELAAPALPGIPVASTAWAPLGWIAAAGVAASVLLVAWFTSSPETIPPDRDAPIVDGGRAPARQFVDGEPGAESEPRVPLHERDTETTPTSVAAASAVESTQDSASATALDSTHAGLAYRVHGRVLGPDGLPVAGVDIHHGDDEARTDAEGRFELTIVVFGFPNQGAVPSLPLIATRQGYRPAVLLDPTADFSDDPLAPQSIELVLGGPPRTLSGRVETVDGSPAIGWKVCLRNPSLGIAGFDPDDRHTLESMAGGQPLMQDVDSEGRFLLEGLLDRPYDVIAWHPESLQHVVAEDVPETATQLVLRAPETSRARRVAGRVTSLAGVPLTGARVRGLLIVLHEVESPLTPVFVLGRAVEVDELGYFAFERDFIDPMMLYVESTRVLRDGLGFASLHSEEDWENLELVLPLRCEIVLDAQSLAPPSDYLAFLDEAGEQHLIQIPEEEAQVLGRAFWFATFLGPGPSRRTIHTSENVVTALFYNRDGTEVERRPVILTPDTPLILSW